MDATHKNFFSISFVKSELQKQCRVREETKYDYRQLLKISDFPEMQPEGYIVKFPFYVLAARDAHIVFSPIERPNWTRDNVYEICKVNEGSILIRYVFCFILFFSFL